MCVPTIFTCPVRRRLPASALLATRARVPSGARSRVLRVAESECSARRACSCLGAAGSSSSSCGASSSIACGSSGSNSCPSGCGLLSSAALLVLRACLYACMPCVRVGRHDAHRHLLLCTYGADTHTSPLSRRARRRRARTELPTGEISPTPTTPKAACTAPTSAILATTTTRTRGAGQIAG